jgi:maleylpyruvate isomerase
MPAGAPERARAAYGWATDGTTTFLDLVDDLATTPDAWATPSLLPGWTRAHVVAHVHQNAVALGRLLTWAQTGVETPMYASHEARDRDIEESSRLGPATLRDAAHESAQALARQWNELPESAWDALVRTAQGREIPASQTLWMRTREVWIHAVDLDRGFGFQAVPGDLRAALASDAAKRHAAGDSGAALVAWLTGRSSKPPQLGSWL